MGTIGHEQLTQARDAGQSTAPVKPPEVEPVARSESVSGDSRSRAQRIRNPIIRLFTSFWFGIALLFLVLAYASIMSALPQVRGAVEVTEMQAFRHWLFALLSALLLISMLLVTFYRSRWKAVNAGGLLTHIGMILLILGAGWYFGSKVEGDVMLRSPQIIIRAQARGKATNVGQLLAETGNEWARFLPGLGGAMHVTVLDTQGDGLTPVATARVRVHIGQNPPSDVTLTDGQPWQRLANGAELGLLTFSTKDQFFDREEVTLYVSKVGDSGEHIKPIIGLPIHRERYTDEGVVLRDTRGEPVPSKRSSPALSLMGLTIPTGWFERWRMPINVDSAGLPFDVQITGYVPYIAEMGARVDGSGEPVVGPDGMIEREPIIEPIERRMPSISARALSAIRLKLTGRGDHADWTRTHWLPFSHYTDVNVQALTVDVPGEDAPWRLVYSRQRHDLGFTLAPIKLSVTYFPGMRGVESYRSDFLVAEGPDATPRPDTTYTNETSTMGGWTLYQSGAAQDGWSYTVLGVGNRRGIWPMSVGWVLITIGCLYAFYVKPVMLRRMKSRGIAK